jgi:hypothetical protein
MLSMCLTINTSILMCLQNNDYKKKSKMKKRTKSINEKNERLK